MIMDDERESLIEYRMHQAIETLEHAKFLIANE
jgi:hypothetical protein